MIRRYSKWLVRLIGIVLFLIILSRLDFAALAAVFARVRLTYFFCAVPLFFCIIGLKVLRWQMLLRLQMVTLSYRRLFFAYVASFFMGVVTPGRFGELAKVLYVKQRGYTVRRSLWPTIVDRLADVAVLVVISSVALLTFSTGLRRKGVFGSGLVVCFACVVLILARYRHATIRILQAVARKLTPTAFRQTVDRATSDLVEFVREFGPVVLFKTLAITLASWMVYYLQLYLIAVALNLDISFLNVIVFISVTSLVALIPITFAGIGTRDAALIYFFGTVGAPRESAVAFSAAMLFLLVVNSLISLAFWLHRPLRLQRERDRADGGQHSSEFELTWNRQSKSLVGQQHV